MGVTIFKLPSAFSASGHTHAQLHDESHTFGSHTGTLTIIEDADQDTKVQVEKTADADKIIFTAGGAEVMSAGNVGTVAIGEVLGSSDTIFIVGNTTGASLIALGLAGPQLSNLGNNRLGLDLPLEFTGGAEIFDSGSVSAIQLLGGGNVRLQNHVEIQGQLILDDSELTINSSGAITALKMLHRVDTENDDDEDDLDTITPFVTTAPSFLFITPAHTDRTIHIKHATGNIRCVDGVDLTMDSTDDWAMLVYEPVADVWLCMTTALSNIPAQTASLAMGSNTITGVTDPSDDQDASTKKYVDDTVHAEAHTVASHSDTTGTGAELETLTDGSETALHSHAGGAGATTELDNLGTVAINTDLISDTDDTDNLGSAAVAWATTFTNLLDLQGTADALILDDDGDTTISAPTDDQIDFEVGGADNMILGGTFAGGFLAVGGTSLRVGALVETSLTQIGGTITLTCLRASPKYSPTASVTMAAIDGIATLSPDGGTSNNVFGLRFTGAVNDDQLTDGETLTMIQVIGAQAFGSISNSFGEAITKTVNVTLAKGLDAKCSVFYFAPSGTAAGDVDKVIVAHLQDTGSTAVVDYVALQIDAETQASGDIFGIYQLGVGMQNRFVSNLNIFGEDATPEATVDVVQDSTSAAQEVLRLQQDDIDDTFINFVGTSAADGSRSISSDTTVDSAKFGAVRVEINGTTKWIRIYDDES